MFGCFVRSRDGAFAIMLALILPVLLAAVGLAVDYTNMLNARSKLQSAADSGVLAASHENLSQAQRDAEFRTYLETNFSDNGMSVAHSALRVESGINHLTITGRATADVNLYFMNHLGARQVSVEASTFRSIADMEIAVVLDNTGSMNTGGINALKRASHALVDEVDNARGPSQQIRMSLVPFVTAVNIKGEGFDDAWIDRDGKALYNGWNFLDTGLREERESGTRRDALPAGFGSNFTCTDGSARCDKADLYPHHMRLFDQSGVSWKGCVEARPEPYNFSMTPPDPSNPDTLFVPYFAPDEPGSPGTADGEETNGNSSSRFNNSWLYDEVAGTQAERLRSTLKYIDPSSKRVIESSNITSGPNRACGTPIVPLTTDLSKVRDGIDAMDFWNGSGTNISEGLAWGWRMLEPGEPFAQAGAYNNEERRKFLVLMTDGTNVSYGASGEITRSDYGSYSFLANGRIDGETSQGRAESKLNDWTGTMCEEMKEAGRDIEIFTVLYKERSQGIQNLFRSCASRPQNFYMTSDTNGLEAAFASIGRQMSALRLTH